MSDFFTDIEETGTSIDKEFRKFDNQRDDRHVKDSECTHRFWIKRCSLCKTILESDAQHNMEPGDKTKYMHTELDDVVCNHDLSKQLKALKIVQKSRLYWIETLDTHIASLRSRENVTLKNVEYSAAFTSSELCRHFYRLREAQMTPEVWEYIGRNALDPNRIARLLIKLRKEK